MPTPAVRNLIRESKSHQIYSVLQTGGSHGMQTMDASLAQLLRAGKITRPQLCLGFDQPHLAAARQSDGGRGRHVRFVVETAKSRERLAAKRAKAGLK